MARADGSVLIQTTLDTSGFKRGLSTITDGLGTIAKGSAGLIKSFQSIGHGADGLRAKANTLSSTFKKLATAMASAFAINKLVTFSKSAIELGSDLAEVQNVVDVTFESMTEDINQFARNAIEQFGLSETAAKQYSSTMGAMLKSSGITGEAMKEMSKSLTALTADMASFYNFNTDEMFAKIRSGISGETEPLKQLGINLSVANLEAYRLAKGITKSYNQMSQAEQIMLRYNYLLSVTADAQGDFARTSDSWANQTRILQERFNALKATIGQGMIQWFTPVIRIMNLLLAKFQTLASAFQAFSESIFGSSTADTAAGYADATDAADAYADANEDVADSIDDANKAQNKYLSGLDEVRRFSDNSTDTGIEDSIEDLLGAASGYDFNLDTSAAEDALDDLLEKAQTIAEVFKQAWANQSDYILAGWQKAVSGIKNLLSEIGDSLYKVFTDGTGQKLIESLLNLLGSVLFLVGSIADAWARAWATGSGDALLHSLFNALSRVISLISKIAKTWADVWDSDFGKTLAKSYLDLFTEILDIIDSIALAWTNAWNNKGQAYVEAVFYRITQINELLRAIGRSFREAWNMGNGQEIIERIYSILTYIDLTVGNIAKRFREDWTEDTIGTTIFNTLLGIIDDFLDAIDRASQKTAEWAASLEFTPLLQSLETLLESVRNLSRDVWDGLEWAYENILLPLAGFTISEVLPRFFQTLSIAIDAVRNTIEALAPIWQKFWKQTLQPMLKMKADAFLQAWDRINAKLTEFAKWCGENPEKVLKITAAIAGLFAALSAAKHVTGLVSLISKLASLQSALSVLTPAVSALSAVFSGPFLVAIGAAVGAGVLIWQNWDQISDKAKEVGPAVMDMATQTVKALGNILSVFGSDSMKQIASDVYSILADIATGIFEIGARLVESVTDILTRPLIENQDGIRDALQGMIDAAQPAVDSLSDLIGNIKAQLTSLYDEHLGPFFEDIAAGVSEICGTIIDGWNTYVSPVLDQIGQRVSALIDGPIGQAVDSALTFIGKLVDAIDLLWVNCLQPVLNWLYQQAMPIIAEVISYISGIALTFYETFAGLINGLFEALSGLIDFLTGVFTGNWQLAWQGIQEIFQGAIDSAKAVLTGMLSFLSQILTSSFNIVQRIFSSISSLISQILQGIVSTMSRIWSGIVDIIKQPLNQVIGFLNTLLGYVNDFVGMVGDTIGGIANTLTGQSINISLSVGKIPYLANGAVIDPNSPFLAVLGDQKSGQNIEAPASLIRTIVSQEMTRSIATFASKSSFKSSSSSSTASVSNANLKQAMEESAATAQYLQQVWSQITQQIMASLDQMIQMIVTAFIEMNRTIGESMTAIAQSVQSGSQATAQAWQSLLTTLQQQLQSYVSLIQSSMQTAQQAVTSGLQGIVQAFSQGWQACTSATQAQWQSIGQGLGQVWESILKLSEKAFPAIAQIVSKSFQSAGSDSEKIWKSIVSKLEAEWKALNQKAQTAYQQIQKTISQAQQKIGTDTTSQWKSISQTVLQAVQSICESAKASFQQMASQLQSAASTMSKAASSSFEQMKNSVQSQIQAMQSLVSTSSQGMQSAMTQAWNNLNSATAQGWSQISQTVQQAIANLPNGLSYALNNLLNTLNNCWIQCQNSAANGWVGVNNVIVNQLNTIQNNIAKFANNVNQMLSNVSSSVSSSASSRSTRSYAMAQGGISIPLPSNYEIPMLATGAVIPPNSPFVAILGDQRSGTNIEAPADLIRQIVADELSKLNTNGGSGLKEIRIPINLSGKQILEAIVTEAKLRQLATGKNIFQF